MLVYAAFSVLEDILQVCFLKPNELLTLGSSSSAHVGITQLIIRYVRLRFCRVWTAERERFNSTILIFKSTAPSIIPELVDKYVESLIAYAGKSN